MIHQPTSRRTEYGSDESYPLLPAQYAELTRASDTLQPERRLMLAVLSDAIVVFQRRALSSARASRLDVESAERWIASDEDRWPYSFVNVCDALGLAHQPLRRALLAWRRRLAERPGRPLARRRLLSGHGMPLLADTG